MGSRRKVPPPPCATCTRSVNNARGCFPCPAAGQNYRGEHPPIIARGLSDIVQARLSQCVKDVVRSVRMTLSLALLAPDMLPTVCYWPKRTSAAVFWQRRLLTAAGEK
jgi:hypothetical protein